jgi:hypothetical protein
MQIRVQKVKLRENSFSPQLFAANRVARTNDHQVGPVFLRQAGLTRKGAKRPGSPPSNSFKTLSGSLKLRLAFSSGWSRKEELPGMYLLLSHRLAASGSTTAHFPVESEM